MILLGFRKNVPSKICPLYILVENVSVENMSVDKMSRCQYNQWELLIVPISSVLNHEVPQIMASKSSCMPTHFVSFNQVNCLDELVCCCCCCFACCLKWLWSESFRTNAASQQLHLKWRSQKEFPGCFRRSIFFSVIFEGFSILVLWEWLFGGLDSVRPTKSNLFFIIFRFLEINWKDSFVKSTET